jgi:hypothetical protein
VTTADRTRQLIAACQKQGMEIGVRPQSGLSVQAMKKRNQRISCTPPVHAATDNKAEPASVGGGGKTSKYIVGASYLKERGLT